LHPSLVTATPIHTFKKSPIASAVTPADSSNFCLVFVLHSAFIILRLFQMDHFTAKPS
jgi:hypothetical protein